MESLFMALAEKTRLRLLNLMRSDQEVCVGSFVKILGVSQPKISRHLAYLRNAGVVRASRGGKWVRYSIARFDPKEARDVFETLFDWLDSDQAMRHEREKYIELIELPESFIFAETHTNERDIERSEPAHNELEEFLL
ncbi:MAG: metalloregulator ArsR/SmtB family transcription factor [Acidobacteriota bacterium]